MAKELDGFNFEQRHGKARVRASRVWRSKEGRRHFMVEWNVYIGLLSNCVAAYVSDDNSGIVATDTMKNPVFVEVKECSEQLSAEEFAILLGKHFTSFYPQSMCYELSRFKRFIRDKYTTFLETRERMLAIEFNVGVYPPTDEPHGSIEASLSCI